MAKTVDKNDLAKMLSKIDQCIDWQTIYALEDDFNQVGLTIQTTSNRRMLLCKLRNGKPISNKVLDDYIFIGGLDISTSEVSEIAAEKMKAFVQNACGGKDSVKNVARKWKDGLRMYEASIAIMGESKDNRLVEDKNYDIIES